AALVQLFHDIMQIASGALGSDFEIAALGRIVQPMLVYPRAVEQDQVELEAVADTGPQGIGFIGLAGAAPVAEAIGSAITAGGGGGTDSRCCGLVGAVGGGLAADKHQEPQRQESISENVGRNSHGGDPLKFARF